MSRQSGECGCGGACGGQGGREYGAVRDGLSRREFVAATGLAALAASAGRGIGAGRSGPFAGPFFADEDFPIPEDKKLDAAWVRSLTARGEPAWVRGEDLRYIGMPVGGLFAGTVYLGGDGRLWNWDIFNQHHEGCVAREPVRYRDATLRERDGANYVDPPEQRSPVRLGFTLRAGGEARRLDGTGWARVSFLGRYPVGTVEYADGACPIAVRLDAFSPFVPLDVEASSHPATVMRYTLVNTSDRPLEAEIVAAFSNPALVHSREGRTGFRLLASAHERGELRAVLCSASESPEEVGAVRPDVPFEDFESGRYEGWEVEGSAFGSRPRNVADIAEYQGDLGAEGEHLVNSHNTRRGEDVRGGDAHTGSLTSPVFTVRRRFIRFRIGGGAHEGRTCVNLLVDGEVVRSATGRDENRMHGAGFDVREFEGREARLQVVDRESGGWGNIGIDEIVFSDRAQDEGPLDPLPDFGTFCVGVVGEGSECETLDGGNGRVWRPVRLEPGASATVSFIVAWHFPNLQIPGLPDKRRWYASRWPDALAVASDLSAELEALTAATLLWRDTWYGGSLPWWLLERTILPIDALATSTCHRFEDGRYWFWEGIGCCHGTCTHVWGYAQAIGRVFPEIERYLRESIDFGLAFHEESGAIDYRAEFGRHVAHDGQCGCILRAYREHLMSPDDALLRRIWPRVKRAVEYMVAEDGDENGLLEGAQYNTLDAAWFGPMGWLSSLYLAAVAAGRAMAEEMADAGFAGRCAAILERGSENMVGLLFNGEYFIHRPDPAHPEANSTNDGCHIDQIYGQAWAHQAGLGRIVPEREAVSALRSLWRYSFAPDVGVYRGWIKPIRGGRWYAAPGEAGLLMCTFPKGGADRATGKGQSAWAAMYFNECMTGFEYQAAAHMVWEGLVEEGLAVTRAIHDRYGPSRRNPYNEIECSDHYGRAMAAYGVFLAVCGWAYDGPRGELAFAPRIRRDEFRAAFTAAEGWGQIEQRLEGDVQRQAIGVRRGSLRLRSVRFEALDERPARRVQVRLSGAIAAAAASRRDGVISLTFAGGVTVLAGQRLEIEVTY